MKLRDLKKGEKFRQFGILFELASEENRPRHDGTEGRQVRYLQPDATHHPARWLTYDLGISGADDDIFNP